MQRSLYTEDHEQYRKTVREFLAREVAPFKDTWDDEGMIPRDIYAKAAAAGVYALQVPEEYGGAGEPDYRYRMVTCEEIAQINALSFGVTLGLQDDLVLAYLLNRTDEEQKRRWLPGFAAGTTIGALAMTEPGTGSDLQGIRTSARRDGDSWVLNGQKTFISSGITADLVVVAACTDPDAGSRGFSLFVVERDTPGFERGRKLRKIGLPAQDTAELFFSDARIPAANLLGQEGLGLTYLMSHLPRERLSIQANSIATMRAIFEITLDYCKQRTAFGKRIADFQHIRFELAEMATEIDVAVAHVDRCLQLHGGYGYMTEYAVAKAYVDTRIQTIYGGTTEITKEIIGRDLIR